MFQIFKLLLLSYFSKLRILFLGKYTESITYDTKNGLITIPIQDFSIGRSLGFKGEWNWEEILVLEGKVNTDSIVFVVGTHVGTILIPLSKKVKHIYGFEANPKTFNYLEKNVRQNFISNSTLFNYAVGKDYGKLDFLQNKVNSGGSKVLPKKKDFAFTFDNPDKISVDTVPIDGFIQKNNLPFPDLLVIDIEGAEFFALQGMRVSLEKCKVLYIEYEPRHLKNVADCTFNDFFDLITSNFRIVTFIRFERSFNIETQYNEFLDLVMSMFSSNTSDDLLFEK